MDTITLQLAEDAYEGDAIAVVTIDGAKQPPVTVKALHSAGAWQTVSYSVPSLASHTVSVAFTNDAYGGSPTKDRNLYIGAITGPMGALGNAQLGLMSNGSHAFTVPGDANAAALAALQVQVAKIMSILATLSGQIVLLGGRPVILSGSGSSSPPNAYAALYPTQIGSGGGAAAASTPSFGSNLPMKGVYCDETPIGTFANYNTFIGEPANTVYASIHTGQASQSDFESCDYELGGGGAGDYGASGYAGPKIINIPLVYAGPDNTPGELLSSAASGGLNSSYDIVWGKIFKAFLLNNRQTTIICRTGWEFNQENGASLPWCVTVSPGNPTDYQNAWIQFYNRMQVARANCASLYGVTPTVLMVFCWNLQGNNPFDAYPGDAYVDGLGIDIYTNVVYGSSTDGDTEFNNISTSEWGLNYLLSQANSHSKFMCFPEFGTNLQNFGRYIELFYTWCTNNNVKYITPWNSNGGGYPGQFYDGTYPEVGATWRHMLNPTTFPVRPIPAPMNFTATAGNGQVTFTATACPSSASVTTYYLYTGTSAGGENIATAAQTSSTPSFTVSATNGTTVYAQMAAGNASSVGFLTAEASATAAAPAANTPPYYVGMGATGYVASSSIPTAVNGPTGDFEVGVTFSPSATDIGSGTNALVGVWGSTGYLQSWLLYLAGGDLKLKLKNSSNTIVYMGVVPATALVAGQWYTAYVKYVHATGVATFYLDPAGHTGAATSQGSATGTAGFQPSVATEDPSTATYPKVTLGADVSSGDAQFNGDISAACFIAGGVTYLNPIVGASSVTDASNGAPTWSLQSTASIGGTGTTPSGNYNLITGAP